LDVYPNSSLTGAITFPELFAENAIVARVGKSTKEKNSVDVGQIV
jgi:hypothetical protein